MYIVGPTGLWTWKKVAKRFGNLDLKGDIDQETKNPYFKSGIPWENIHISGRINVIPGKECADALWKEAKKRSNYLCTMDSYYRVIKEFTYKESMLDEMCCPKVKEAIKMLEEVDRKLDAEIKRQETETCSQKALQDLKLKYMVTQYKCWQILAEDTTLEHWSKFDGERKHLRWMCDHDKMGNDQLGIPVLDCEDCWNMLPTCLERFIQIGEEMADKDHEEFEHHEDIRIINVTERSRLTKRLVHWLMGGMVVITNAKSTPEHEKSMEEDYENMLDKSVSLSYRIPTYIAALKLFQHYGITAVPDFMPFEWRNRGLIKVSGLELDKHLKMTHRKRKMQADDELFMQELMQATVAEDEAKHAALRPYYVELQDKYPGVAASTLTNVTVGATMLIETIGLKDYMAPGGDTVDMKPAIYGDLLEPGTKRTKPFIWIINQTQKDECIALFKQCETTHSKLYAVYKGKEKNRHQLQLIKRDTIKTLLTKKSKIVEYEEGEIEDITDSE